MMKIIASLYRRCRVGFGFSGRRGWLGFRRRRAQLDRLIAPYRPESSPVPVAIDDEQRAISADHRVPEAQSIRPLSDDEGKATQRAGPQRRSSAVGGQG
jgi:hypothetical protein